MNDHAHEAIRAAIDAETQAWDAQDVDRLLDVFHPDIVWPWPPGPDAHDPAEWIWGLGRFDAVRWRGAWQELFDSHELVHNRRTTVRISVAPDGGGGLGVVDVDTLWRRRDDGAESHWLGRAGKVYSRVTDGWKLIMHTGLLAYPPAAASKPLPLPSPPLRGGGVVLRPWSDADVGAANRATQDRSIAEFTGVPPAPTLEQTRAFLLAQPALRSAGSELTLAIADAETDAFCGSISLLRFEWASRRAEIGYWVAPWARGGGRATHAVRLLARWALGELGLVRLALHTHPENAASQRVAERAGFTREGTLRGYDIRGGRIRDLVSFSLLSGERG